jgi:PAS domain-containing protein
MNMNTDRETSESKQTSEALHEQREWLRVTFSCIGDAVITTDTHGGVTFLKPGGSVLDRLDARGRSEEVAGRGFQDRH